MSISLINTQYIQKPFLLVWGDWSTDTQVLNGDADGWISDCGSHMKDVGTQQRLRSCESPDDSDVANILCAVNTDDMETGKDFTRECVGPSEMLNAKKHCQRIIERQSIYCPGISLFITRNFLLQC